MTVENTECDPERDKLKKEFDKIRNHQKIVRQRKERVHDRERGRVNYFGKQRSQTLDTLRTFT